LKIIVDSQSHLLPDGVVGDDARARRDVRAHREPGGRQVLPEGLGEMAPGAALGAVLETP